MKPTKDIQAAAARFKKTWSDPARGGEKQDSQLFWTSLLSDVFGVEDIATFIHYEEKVKLDNTSFIDGHIPSTRVLIEQKSRGKDLNKAIRQSDDTLLTPYQQAKRYSSELPLSEHPKWIVLSNFDQFHVYDMEKPQGDPEIVYLQDLDKDYYRLSFLVDDHQDKILQKEMEISVKAGEIVGQLYDALLKEYKDPEDSETLKSLNELIVRLVFCFYAEDAGIFGSHLQFHDYMKDRRNPRGALIDLFSVLDTPDDKRDPYLDEELLAFPYVNGGLFANHGTEIPRLNDEIMEIIVHEASEDFDWSEISPTIFGAVFESTLNPTTRRSGGMHYTSLENIHRVIDPLFLSDLQNEFDEIKDILNRSSRTKKLKSFQGKIANLKFLDPACGSGNFLTETYISLRKLENEVLKLLLGDQIRIGLGEEYDPIKVSLSQFYGIEINDFAVSVARTALWIAEHQMMKKTEEILHSDLDFLPLKTYTNIHEGNSLRIDWNDVISKYDLDYIMGNPPFVGTKFMDKSQKSDSKLVLGKIKKFGVLDYVSCWYKKSEEFIDGTDIKVAFVSTNSICQGEQVPVLWKELINRGVEILFAYQTFVWDSEANDKAHVHCVIVGFTKSKQPTVKRIYSGKSILNVSNISPYLTNSENIFIESRRSPICNVLPMYLGCDYKDGDNYIFTEEEMKQFISEEPQSEVFFRPYMTGRDFIKRKSRYCLWFDNENINQIKKCPSVKKRIDMVKEFRENSNSPDTKRYAEYPLRPARLRYYSDHNNESALALPRISSQTRKYLPMEMFGKDVIGGASILLVPNADLYTFGVLMSNVHMSWMRYFCGRMKSDYSYSNGLIYNTFPWPNPTDRQRELIEKTAQAILDAREIYPDLTLADLYDDVTMPPELRKAHQMNDRAVMNAYGFSYKGEDRMSETDCAAALMQMYQKLVNK